MIPVDGQTMREVAPRFSGELAERQDAILHAVGPALAPTLDAYQINTRLRIAHFLAQTCHESAGFRTTEEFASGQAYEGRVKGLGNTEPGDGPRFKGRGLLQLTGRANYREMGKVLKLPLEEEPERAAEPVLSLAIACEFWKGKNINPLCDRDDVVAVTRAVNGGTNGLAERSALTAKAKAAVARIEAMIMGDIAPPAGKLPVLRRGSRGEAVGNLQQLLRTQGFPLARDEDFSAATELAVMSFQTRRHLLPDGIVGEKTWAALSPA